MNIIKSTPMKNGKVREFFAAAAMQGLVTSGCLTITPSHMADAMMSRQHRKK